MVFPASCIPQLVQAQCPIPVTLWLSWMHTTAPEEEEEKKKEEIFQNKHNWLTLLESWKRSRVSIIQKQDYLHVNTNTTSNQ
jgi:hypothetical protein